MGSKRGIGEILTVLGVAMLILGAGVIGWIARAPSPQAHAVVSTQPPVQAAQSNYTPQTRSFVMTIVPYWVHEETGVFDYLKGDFSKKGILNGKEVWGFNPSSITVYQGDTVDIVLYNPSSDPHTWTLDGMDVNVPVDAQAKADVHFTASEVGLFQFNCEVGEHFPFMTGQLTVLPDSAAPQG